MIAVRRLGSTRLPRNCRDCKAGKVGGWDPDKRCSEVCHFSRDGGWAVDTYEAVEVCCTPDPINGRYNIDILRLGWFLEPDEQDTRAKRGEWLEALGYACSVLNDPALATRPVPIVVE